MTLEEQLRWVRPPVQDRSQKTMERLLEAAEALIAEVGFEKATIAEIARRAESSVGAFYSRFADKDALLRCLLDRFIFESQATIDQAMRPELWEHVTVEQLCTSLLSFLSKVLRERRLFVVAISKAAMDDPSAADFRALISEHAAEALSGLVEKRGETVKNEDVSKAMRVVAWVCLSVLEAGCVNTRSGMGGVDQGEFISELGTMIVAYLGLDTKPSN